MTQKNIKKSKHNKKSKNNKSYKKLAFVIILILLCFIIIKNRPEKNNYKTTQIILNNENITAQLEKEIIIEDKIIYMSYEDIKNFLDSTLYTENETGLVITTSDKKVGVIDLNAQTLKINGSNVDVKNIAKINNETSYIAISNLNNVYNYKIEYIESNNIITIDNLNKKCIKAYTKTNVKIKKDSSMFSKYIEKVKKGDWLYYIEDKDGYSKVRTQSGNIGYVKKKKLTNFVNERDDFIEATKTFKEEESISKDITNVDISSFEKRQNIINSLLQQAVKNDKMYVNILYSGENSINYERFKIEAVPMLKECGIEVKF